MTATIKGILLPAWPHSGIEDGYATSSSACRGVAVGDLPASSVQRAPADPWKYVFRADTPFMGMGNPVHLKYLGLTLINVGPDKYKWALGGMIQGLRLVQGLYRTFGLYRA